MIKKIIIFAGGVLVLAACDSATAPSISKYEGGNADAKAKPAIVKPKSGGMQTMSGLCTLWIRDGNGDSTLVTGACPPVE